MRNYLTTYDPFFDLFFPVEGETNRHHHNLMKTDIVEKKDSYLLKINVPGVKKEDIKVSLDKGYLTIDVQYKEEIKDDEKYLYQERRIGEYSRSYNVGENVTEKDIDAKIENGVLFITIKKEEPKEQKAQYIDIH